MGKVLKILTVVVFALSIVVFIIGMMLFNKRELLIARTHVLENSIIALASTLEANDLEEVDEVHEEYDDDEVSDMPNDNPKKSEIWEDYNDKYEQMSGKMLNLDTEKLKFQLRQYYFLAKPESPSKADYEAGEPVKTSLGKYKTDGDGTMRDLLDQVQDRANKQHKTLTETRVQLKYLREQLEKVIGKLNDEKKAHRLSKTTIKELNGKIAELEIQIDGLNKKISQLEREKAELADTKTELEAELALKVEENQSLAQEIASLKEEIKRLSAIDTTGAVVSDAKTVVSTKSLTPGTKGEVVRVENEFSLVIVKLTDEAMKELLGEDLSSEFTPIELMVKRDGFNGPAGEIVTRIRIDRISRDGSNLGYADNLYGWEQTPLKDGDKVVY